MENLFESNCFKTQRNLIDRLRSIGLDKYIELPQIAVMGDTSSGKSSVLSAISGIEFPSSDTLTTRCPTQIVLSEADKFSGTVCLVRFGSGISSHLTHLKNRNEITTEIARLTQVIRDEGQTISDDAIVIEVRGPEYPNLTLTDLPGIIRTVQDNEDPAMIPRVRQLVDRYLVQKRTVILAVVPANVDFHNSEILQAAEKVDPKGERTIAIITKPDAIDPGAEQSVLDLLMNKKKALRLGYHAVRCRGKQHHDDKMTIPEGLEMEHDFFHNHKVWKSVAPSYVGCERLTEKLVKVLRNIITDSLPIVLKEIMDKLLKCEESLEQVGSGMNTAQSRRLVYSSFVAAALQLMKDALQGDYADLFFATSTSEGDCDNRAKAIIRKHDSKFQQEVDSTLFEEKYVARDEIKIGDWVETLENGHTRICRVEFVEGKQIKCLGKMHLKEYCNAIKELDLTSLKKQIVDNRGDELSIFPSYKLFCSLMREYIQKWDAPMKTLLASYAHVCQDVFRRILRHCGDEKFSRLNEHSAMVLDQCLKTVRATTNRVIAESLHAEYRPFTMNPALYENLIKLRNEPLKHALEGLTAKGCRDVNLDAVYAILAMNGIGAQGDDHREALELHVALKAYLEVAKKRVVDKFPMLLQEHFVCKLLDTLQIQFASISDEQLEALLSESKATQNYRHQLGSELESLKAAEKEISSMYYSSNK
ncbi:P-loop containing nucleoside triphosphate hydrolase protein [Chytriomyces cf. hyalinus JEL632]|nr:P-loop containing nucleoside triphosphate hydrolase protein [Chytriomyces cf. hyalinus JEL632]